MKYQLPELIDINRLQALTDSFYEITRISTAITDMKGTVLTSSGWQNICSKFHRINPLSRQKCVESHTTIANKLLEDRKYAVYECLNGLVEVAISIIIEGDHVANFLTGQLLFKPADPEFFRKQAYKYEFDETAYLEALSDVPVIPRKRIEPSITFFSYLSELIEETGTKQRKLLDAAERL
ncbi:PocR ligand-binding domain-containing protein [Desulfonema magnum]|uniref:PocR domain-containing protein n=1 Tax=Desulfonema magnum TaxID=45655 RepID=A0A975BQE5_9BACT|nr:PocR ligand-binding domain-containing protein [Desulfonema magnum]QTA89736.1 PocR domain-containing protein [Desulfonema magnum]